MIYPIVNSDSTHIAQSSARHHSGPQNRITTWLRQIGKIGLLLCLAACQSHEEELLHEEEGMTIPIVFNLQMEGENNSPSPRLSSTLPQQEVAREVFADHIALYVYHRPLGPAYKNSEEGFVLDPENSNIVLPCFTQPTWPHLNAKGHVYIRKDMEYRVVALGYAVKKEEDKCFEQIGKRFEHAQLRLSETSKGYITPELFYGTPVVNTASKDTVFSYKEVHKGASMLEGWLYRGVAGIELELTNIGKDFEKMELLTDSIHTTVHLRHYDDFLTPEGKVTKGDYLLGECMIDQPKDGNTVKIIYPNLLPICTNLKVRATKTDGSQEVYQLRLRETSTTRGFISRSIPDDGGNGTGIITGEPDYPDPDQPDKPDSHSPYEVCFKRNHYYKIKGDFTQMNNMKYVLEVVVNPYWEKDVDLPLEK